MQHGPELQDASITAMPFYIMDGSVFLLVRDVNQDTTIADTHVINGGEQVPKHLTRFVAASSLEFEKSFRVAC